MLENKIVQHPENVGIRKNGYYEQGKGSHAHDLFLEKSLNFIDRIKGIHSSYIPFAFPMPNSSCLRLQISRLQISRLAEIPKIAGTGNTGGAKGNAGYGSPYKEAIVPVIIPTPLCHVSRMDASVGKSVKSPKIGLKKKTLVIFQAIMEPQLKGDKRWTSSKAQVL